MEENGMKKLMKLFKDYVDNYGTDAKNTEKEYGIIDYGQGFQYGTREYLYETIISKKFLFIDWLVRENKIDLEKLLKAIKENKIYCGKWGKVRNMLLMLLAIQDEPIDFLISVLK